MHRRDEVTALRQTTVFQQVQSRQLPTHQPIADTQNDLYWAQEAEAAASYTRVILRTPVLLPQRSTDHPILSLYVPVVRGEPTQAKMTHLAKVGRRWPTTE